VLQCVVALCVAVCRSVLLQYAISVCCSLQCLVVMRFLQFDISAILIRERESEVRDV